MNDITNSLKRISFDSLPKYSDWPARLISLEEFKIKYKTEKEVLREYEDEKWGELLNNVKSLEKPTLYDVDELFGLYYKNKLPFYYEGDFYLADMNTMMDLHLNLYEKTLRPHLEGASCLVELGAGYGSKLFKLAQRDIFCDLPILAGEFTKNGQELISILADSLNKKVDVGYCDFRNMKIENISIPEGAVIFTSYAAHYVPNLLMKFVDFMTSFKPKAVIHFEPCYENYSVNSVHGMLCRRYVELNDYTRNLIGVLKSSEVKNEISMQVSENIIGSNPFLPISIIEWKLNKDN